MWSYFCFSKISLAMINKQTGRGPEDETRSVRKPLQLSKKEMTRGGTGGWGEAAGEREREGQTREVLGGKLVTLAVNVDAASRWLLNDRVRDRADAFGLPRADCEVPWKYPGVHIKLMVEWEGESSDKYSSHEYVTCRTQFELRSCIKLLRKSIRTENRTEPG